MIPAVSGNSPIKVAGHPPNTVNGGTIVSGGRIELSKILQLLYRMLL
jgi:hypothetical protein